jgi:hypothetical protein
LNSPASPIAPELFDRVDEYTEAIAHGQSDDDGAAIFLFSRNFFLQFFDNVLHETITGFNEEAELAATRLRLSLTGADLLPVRRVIVRFEKFCEMSSDPTSGLYYPTDKSFLERNKLYLPRLLRSIAAWATSAGLADIARRSQLAADNYLAAMHEFDGTRMSDADVLDSPGIREQVRIVELDYDRTSKFIEGVTGSSATIRGLLMTAWVAVIVLAFDTSRWVAAAISFAIVVIFGLLDAYHAVLYQRALGHATELEDASKIYYDAVALGTDDPFAEFDLQIFFGKYRFGLYRNLRQFSIKDLRLVRPRIFFAVLYPALLVVSVISAVVLEVTHGGH